MRCHILHRDGDRAGHLARLERAGCHRPDVDDHRRSACFDQCIEFGHADAGHAQRVIEAPSLPEFPGDVGRQRHPQPGAGNRGQVLHVRHQQLDLRPEQCPCEQDQPHPEHGTEAAQQQEARPCHAGGAGQWRRDDGQSRHELREQDGSGTPAFEAQLRLTDAGVGIQRDTAEHLHHAVTVDPAREIPTQIGNQACQRRTDEQFQAEQPVIRRERTGHDQRWRRRHRQSDLVEQYVGDDEPDAPSIRQRIQ